jgi:hypothetical protein
MQSEKTSDPSLRIFRRLLVIRNLYNPQRLKPPLARIIHERVPCFRILFHVVRNTCCDQRPL